MAHHVHPARARRLPLKALLPAILCLALPGMAAAASGTVMQTSVPGLAMTVDTRWVDCYGYRPMWIEFNRRVPLNADRTLHVELHANSIYGRTREMTVVAADVELPAGATRKAVCLAVPQCFPWHAYALHVWEDGEYLEKLAQQNVSIMANWNQRFFEGLPGILVIADKNMVATTANMVTNAIAAPANPAPGTTALLPDPDTTALAAVLPVGHAAQQWGGYQTTTPQQTPQLPTIVTLPVDRLPRGWIHYSGLDIICLSMSALDELAGAPDRLAAVSDWVAAGGNLIVYGAGADFASLGRIDKLLKLPAQGAGGSGSAAWLAPDNADFTDRIAPPFGKQDYESTVFDPPDRLPPPERPAFMRRPLGRGMVLAAAADDLFAQPSEHWTWMLNTLGPERWLWYRRHGLSIERSNDGFWNWLVPGVGLAPVMEFRVLITLFVLAIGPLNYLWLRRRGKLHLLVVIVPVSAAAITAGLFAFAMVSDGLGVKMRVRSFTEIDQRRGQAVCWGRLSYYAGLRPSGGLDFPGDVTVMPLQPWGAQKSASTERRELIWDEGRQNLVGGWLPARTSTQMLTVRSRSSRIGLDFTRDAAAGTARVKNRLGTRIHRLLIADDSGQQYAARDLAAGQSVTLSTDLADVQAEMRDLIERSSPAIPADLKPHQLASSGFGRRSYYWYGPSSEGVAPPDTSTSILEQGIGTAASWLVVPASFPPRSYVAVVDRSPEIVLGVESPREEASLHVVVGRW